MVTRKKNGEATTSPTETIKTCTTIVAEETPQVQLPQELEEISPPVFENKFTSLEDFKLFVKDVFINKSGIAPELYATSVEFHQEIEWGYGMDAETPIHDELGWYFARFTHQVKPTIYAAFLRNEDGSLWQAIVNLPDADRQRPYRYLAPKRNGDRAFLPPVPTSIRKKIASRYGVDVPMDGSFWDWLAAAKIPRIVTEGGKKSLAALSQGYCAIALYGCRCGAGKSKDDDGIDLEPRLTSDLERLALENSIWLLGMDRDDSHKAKISVSKGKKRLTEALKTVCNPYLEDIVWRTEQGKGIDDLIVNSGSGAFDRAYSDAIARLEKKFKPGTPGQYDEPEKQKNPPPDQQAKRIAEDYRQLIAFNDETKLWMRYEADSPGVWSPESNEYMESIIYKILAGDNIQNFGSDYVTGILKLLRHELIERRWNEVSPRDWLPFTNGVVEIATGKLHKHAPGFRLTWTLPRDYSDTPGKWDNINNFLEHLSDGNPNIKELLICFCNAVIKGRYDLQKFLHLIGLGGTGKGTFARLVTELIGQQNILVTNLQVWCTNQFEGYNAFGKRLVIFPDEDPYKGGIGRFLSLTGEDKIRAEEKRKKSFNFDYQGMTLVCSNFPIFAGGSSSRAKRRTITVPCNRRVVERQRRELSKVFEPELAAFTLYLLSLDDDHVSRVMKGEKEIPQCTLEFWENQMKGDSVSSWINDCIVYDINALTPIGNDRNEGNNGTPYTLFGSYVSHCLKTGGSPKSSRTFSPDLIETCQTILNWPIQKEINKKGTFIRGLRLRLPELDEEIPTYDHWLNQRISADDIQGDISGGGSGGG
ncbi:DUF3854 domain-containing protein [Nodularia sp. LEGE 04288]|nr:DUF3854 domain-containing protein [Nodularia sp. LEGE 04288]MCC2694082.1 DUF3854 domain-containing protein [Nodularia sp. LEGE 04288]